MDVCQLTLYIGFTCRYGPNSLTNQQAVSPVEGAPYSDQAAVLPLGWYTSCEAFCPTTTTAPVSSPKNTSVCCNVNGTNPFACQTVGYDIITAGSGFGGVATLVSNQYGITPAFTLLGFMAKFVHMYVSM